jgi:hypothetical protein
VVVIGCVAGLIAFLNRDQAEDGDGFTPDPNPSVTVSQSESAPPVTGSPAPSASATATSTAAPTTSSAAETTAATDPTTGTSQTTTTTETTGGTQPTGGTETGGATNPYQAYCDLYSVLEAPITQSALEAQGVSPVEGEPVDTPDDVQLKQLQDTVINSVSPLLSNIDAVQATNPPADISSALAEIRSDFAELLAIFQRHYPANLNDAMDAYDWSFVKKNGMSREDYLEQQLTWVQTRSHEICG